VALVEGAEKMGSVLNVKPSVLVGWALKTEIADGETVVLERLNGPEVLHESRSSA